MHYLVDGHNLIPKVGLRLDSFDDENALITRLQEFCRLRRARVEVYFDNAPPGFPARRQAGSVTAHFVRQGSSADAAIEKRLEKLGNAARNWTVVSSDRRVQQAAGAVHAGIISSDEFAALMNGKQHGNSGTSQKETTPSPGEVQEWLELFKGKNK